MNSPRKRPGLLFTLVGPAGAGKNSLMKDVLKRTPLRQIPTATTRAIRPGEQEGREHLYVSRDEFQRMIDADALLEHQVIHGNLYGIPRRAVESALDSGDALIADIEVYGAARAREVYPENVISIFIQPPSIGSLIERMRERRESEAEIGKRLLRVPMELDYARDCSYIVLNDSLDDATELLHKIVVAELNGTSSAIYGDRLILYRFQYAARIIPMYRDEALRRTSAPNDLVTPFDETEMPHQAALRCLHEALGIDVGASALASSEGRDGDYLPPVTLEYWRDERDEYVTYVYVYCLDERIDAPAGWEWTPAALLPQNVRKPEFECAT
ncbi:MAG: hypothetical protein ABI835_09415 [Chloroflexota bacterium]